MSICHRTINHKKILNVPLDALICPLQIINNIESLSSTLHGVNTHFIHHHPMWKITRSAISRKPVNQKKKKKVLPSYIFLHLSANFGAKIQNTHCHRNWATFLTFHQSALNGPANGLAVRYSKIQNWLSRVP